MIASAVNVTKCRVPTGPGKSCKVLEFEKCPGKSWKALGFAIFYEKSWNFIQYLSDEFSFPSSLYEFLPSCYLGYSTRFFLVYLPVSRNKIKKMLQFTFS